MFGYLSKTVFGLLGLAWSVALASDQREPLHSHVSEPAKLVSLDDFRTPAWWLDQCRHPTEFTPGNPSGLPSGVDINATDLDYTGMIMPPPGSNVKVRRL